MPVRPESVRLLVQINLQERESDVFLLKGHKLRGTAIVVMTQLVTACFDLLEAVHQALALEPRSGDGS